jgi:hypothetical protein
MIVTISDKTKLFRSFFRHYGSNPVKRVGLRAYRAFGAREYGCASFFLAPHVSRLRQRGGVLAVHPDSAAR